MATGQRPRSARLLVVLLVSISLAVITLDFRGGTEGPLETAGEAALSVIAPMQAAVTRVTEPVEEFFIGLAHLPTLADENRRLRAELAEARAQAASFANLQQDYQDLLDLNDLRAVLDPPTITAIVVSSGVGNFDWTITIDRGREDGVRLNQPVVAGNAEAPMVVGRVVRVAPSDAQVQLIIDRRSSVFGVLEESGEAGIVVGQGQEDLRMDLVTAGTPVTANERVFTKSYELNGQRGIFPPGLLIGEVSSARGMEGLLEETVRVRPAVDFATLDYVLVLVTEEGLSD